MELGNASLSPTEFAQKTALVTGANSGLGFEAAAQLADAGYGRVILACRTLEKAERAKRKLAERVGSDPFETLAIDVSSIESSKAAGNELVRRGHSIDALLLNAGMASETMEMSADGLELSFASSIIGHHVLTLLLLEAGLLPQGARVVISGSESANNDLPAILEFQLYDFAAGTPREFGENLHDAMVTFAKGGKPGKFVGTRYYATTKAFACWWSDAMTRRFGDRISVFTVSPGSNLSTNVTRHATGFKGFLLTKVMPVIGPALGVGHDTSAGAKRYLDVLHDVGGPYVSGKTYTSKPGKLIGPLQEMTHSHLTDVERQEAAWAVLTELTAAER